MGFSFENNSVSVLLSHSFSFGGLRTQGFDFGAKTNHRDSLVFSFDVFVTSEHQWAVFISGQPAVQSHQEPGAERGGGEHNTNAFALA